MIDPAMGWFEIVEFNDKQSITIASLVEKHWLCRYPWPQLITYDCSSRFIGKDFKEMIKRDYNI